MASVEPPRPGGQNRPQVLVNASTVRRSNTFPWAASRGERRLRKAVLARSQGDSDLPSDQARFEVADRVGYLAERIGPLEARDDLARLDEGRELLEIA